MKYINAISHFKRVSWVWNLLAVQIDTFQTYFIPSSVSMDSETTHQNDRPKIRQEMTTYPNSLVIKANEYLLREINSSSFILHPLLIGLTALKIIYFSGIKRLDPNLKDFRHPRAPTGSYHRSCSPLYNWWKTWRCTHKGQHIIIDVPSLMSRKKH